MEPEKEDNFLEPKHFIKEKSDLTDYECTICYQLPARPVRCMNCRKSFCMGCVSDQKKIKDVCPFRCSQKFSIQVVRDISIQFICPYSQDCTQPIRTIRQFYDHDLVCHKISDNDKKFKTYLRQYLCLNGKHTLQFFVGTYDEMCNELQCSHCHKKKLCRSICRPCNERFCIQCRPVPASKKQCPVGHNMSINSFSNINYICDICGLPSILTGKQTYADEVCNFGICKLCYEQLPQERPPIICIENNPQYCSKYIQESESKQSHRLVIDKNSKELIKCEICQKVRKCIRKCLSCETHFCFDCKTFLIEANDTCELDHNFKINNSGKKKCDRCLQIYPKVHEDKFCGISLCQNCFKYGKIMKSDRQKFVKSFFCDKGHLLMLHTSNQNFAYLCSKCQIYNEIKFFCPECGNNKLYCCRCYPLPIPDQCYLGHPLKPMETELIVCHMCSGKGHSEAHGSYSCSKCNLSICRKCYKRINSVKKPESLMK